MPVRPVIRAGFDHLKTQKHYSTAFVIMPNHVHIILYFPGAGFNHNKIRSNAKGFMPACRTGRAYEIIKRLQQMQKQDILNYLAAEIPGREKKKGQLHKVFIDSFDAKTIYNEKFF